LAHAIVPPAFERESVAGGQFQVNRRQQDIDRHPERLTNRGINQRKTELTLEIKLS